MSVGNPAPIFSLVREDTLRTSEATYMRQAASVPAIDAGHDEIRLIAPNGEPCAFPMPNHQSRDNEHELIGGGRVINRRVIETEINLAIDYIDNATRRRMERWMYDRARVLFTPGYGARTELAWRPIDGITSYDLTNRWALTALHDAASSWVWDALSTPVGVMRLYSAAYGKVIRTPFGAGQVFDTTAQNRFYTGSPPGSYPVGTSDADSGWTSGGAWAADITREYQANGFGCTDCPGALRVYSATRRTGDGVNSRLLIRTLPAAVTGPCSVWVGVMVRGRGGSGLSLSLHNSTAGVVASRDLSGLDLSEWTMVWISGYYAAWPGVPASQLVSLNLTPAIGVADDFDLKIGPIVGAIHVDSTELAPAYPHWLLNTRASGDAVQVSSFVAPSCGSAQFSFYVPPSWVYDATTPWCAQLMKPTSANDFRLYLRGGSGRYPNVGLVLYWGAGVSDSVAVDFSGPANLRPGYVTTIGFTWDSARLVIYVNGVAIHTRTGSIQPLTAAANFTFWGNGTYGMAGLIPIGMRIDNEVFSAGMMADLHRNASDAGASDLIVGARGRSYLIDSIPSSSRSTAGGMLWTGNLRLRQVGYTAALADLTCREP